MKNIKQGSPEWLKQREGKITGSRVGAILGLSPWTTRQEVMDRLLGRSKFHGNIATRYGNYFEDEARRHFELATGFVVEEAYFVQYDHWRGASPDGYVGDLGLLEIKCPYGRRDDANFKTLREQPYYYAQVQYQLFCTGRKYCWFYQWSIYGERLELVVIDHEYLAKIMPKLEEFYNEYLDRLSKEGYGPSKESTQPIKEYDMVEYTEAVARYAAISEEMKALREERDEIKEILSELDHGTYRVDRYQVTRGARKGGVAYGKIVKEHLPDIDLEPYRGASSETLTITIKE